MIKTFKRLNHERLYSVDFKKRIVHLFESGQRTGQTGKIKHLERQVKELEKVVHQNITTPSATTGAIK